MQVEMQASKLFKITAEGNTHTEVFANLASLAEPFSVSACGACDSPDIVPIMRVVDDNTHYEYKCRNCNARLTLSKNKKGDTLFPRKKYNEKQSEVKAGKAKAGEWIPNNGWEKYMSEARNDETEDASVPKVNGR